MNPCARGGFGDPLSTVDSLMKGHKCTDLSSPNPLTAMETLERNKKTVLTFYDRMFNQSQPTRAVEQFVGQDYIQHNPLVGDGKDGLISWMEELARMHPGKHVQFERTIAEGDLVAVHCRIQWPSGRETAGMDIFRLDEDGKIAEHWGLLQQVPDEAANSNTMF